MRTQLGGPAQVQSHEKKIPPFLFPKKMCSQPKPLRPLTDNTHASAIVMVGAPNSATASNGAHRRSKSTVVDPPNGLRAAHVPTAFPTAAAEAELPNDVNRSIAWTYCNGTAGDSPYAAAGIVACNRIVVIEASCTQ